MWPTRRRGGRPSSATTRSAPRAPTRAARATSGTSSSGSTAGGPSGNSSRSTSTGVLPRRPSWRSRSRPATSTAEARSPRKDHAHGQCPPCAPRPRLGGPRDRGRPGHPRSRRRDAQRLLDLARELGAAHVRGVREGDRHQGQLRPLLLGRGAGPRDRREGQPARGRALRRAGRDARGRDQGGHLRALHAARVRPAARALQAPGRPVGGHRRRPARLHEQHQVPQGKQSQAARVLGRPARSRLQEHAADGRRPHVGDGGDAHLLHPRGQRSGRDEGLRLHEEEAAQRAGLHQERRRRHPGGRPRPGGRRHLLHRGRARHQGQGLRRHDLLPEGGDRHLRRGRRAPQGREEPGARQEAHRLGDLARHAGPLRQAQDQLRARPPRRRGGAGSRGGPQGRQDLPHRRRLRGRQPQADRRAVGERSAQPQGVTARPMPRPAGPRAPGAPRDPALLATVAVLWVLLGLFVLFALASLLARVLIDGGRLSLAGAVAILGHPHQLRALGNSLLLASLVGAAGTALGFLFALTATRAGLGRGWVAALDAITLLPLISPPFTTAIAMIFSFGPRGLVTYHLFGIKGFTVYGLGSTFASEALTYFPIAYLTLKPVLAAIDANVEDMALSLGASRRQVFGTVTLPLAAPGLANAFLLLFAASLADFATPLILAGNGFPVLPTQAYLQITGLFDLRRGAMLSFAPLLAALTVYLLQRYWVSRRYYVTVTGRAGAGTTVKTVAPWVRPVLAALCLAVAAVVAYFYALLFYASIVVALGANHAWTFRRYHLPLTEPANAIRHTLVLPRLITPL